MYKLHFFFILFVSFQVDSAKAEYIRCVKKLTCLIHHSVNPEWIFKLESSVLTLRGGG